MIALWVGPCVVCGFTGKSLVTRSCPRCGAHQLRRDAAFEHAMGNHVTAAAMLEEADRAESEVRRG